MNIQFVTDSTIDLPDSYLKEKNISSVPLYINIGNESFRDKVDISRENFYRNLPSFKHHPTTAVPGIEAFERAYQEKIDHGAKEIFSLHISKGLSNTVDVARLAAEKTSNVPVHVIDSGNLSMGTGLLLQLSVRMAEAGEKAQEIMKAIMDAITRTYTVAALDTLEFLRRSGRLSNFQYGLGSLLFIKPILKMNDGKVSMERVRTRKGARKRVVEILESIQPIEEFAFVHTNAVDELERFRSMVTNLLPDKKDIPIGEVTPVIGAHIGPGAVGFSAIAEG